MLLRSYLLKSCIIITNITNIPNAAYAHLREEQLLRRYTGNEAVSSSFTSTSRVWALNIMAVKRRSILYPIGSYRLGDNATDIWEVPTKKVLTCF